MIDPDHQQERLTALEQQTRALSERLARTAEDVADTFDRAADLHEEISADERHPLHEGAAHHASLERAMASAEREEAQRIRRLVEEE